MPGTEHYTQQELSSMSANAYLVAQQNGFVKPGTVEAPPTPAPSQDGDYAPTAWGSTEYDFVAPSGQRCRMRKVQVEKLIEGGILDKVTRLPGLTEDVIRKAEGVPPVKASADAMPPKETMRELLAVLDELIPMVVIKPHVERTPEDPAKREQGVVYTDMIDLADRVAIMERAISGVAAFEAFRN